jgi:hypothetical protein
MIEDKIAGHHETIVKTEVDIEQTVHSEEGQEMQRMQGIGVVSYLMF